MIIPSKEFLYRFKTTQGALSVCESIAIMNIAATAPDGNYIECGSHAGKSGMSAAYGLKNYESPSLPFYLIDPCFDLANEEAWKHTIQGDSSNMGWMYVKKNDFNKSVEERIKFASDGKIKPVLMGDYSENVLPKFDNYGYVFIDSDNHQAERVFAEVDMIKDRMVEGGIIAFHDFGHQYIAPREAHEYLIATKKFKNIPIDWEEIFSYVRENNLEEGNNSWHEKGSEEFPKFVGAVRKI